LASATQIGFVNFALFAGAANLEGFILDAFRGVTTSRSLQEMVAQNHSVFKSGQKVLIFFSGALKN